MSKRSEKSASMASLAKQDRGLLLALLGVLVVVFALVGSNVGASHAPKPHNLPIGVIGTASEVGAVARSLGQHDPGGYRVKAYGSLAAARAAILRREVYGAFRPAPTPLVLLASAASSSVESLLQGTFTAVAAAQGKTLAVDDLVPLPSSDSRGTTAFSMLLGLIIAGLMGAAVIYLLGRHRSPVARLGATVLLGIGAGLVATLVTNVVVGAFHGHFLAVWGVATLFVLALGLSIAGFLELFGVSGIGVGALIFLIIGYPASGGSSAPELLPGFWRGLSQLLPPGAAITAIRDTVYFHGHSMTKALLVLGIFAILGVAIVVTVQMLRGRTRSAAAVS